MPNSVPGRPIGPERRTDVTGGRSSVLSVRLHVVGGLVAKGAGIRADGAATVIDVDRVSTGSGSLRQGAAGTVVKRADSAPVTHGADVPPAHAFPAAMSR